MVTPPFPLAACSSALQHFRWRNFSFTSFLGLLGHAQAPQCPSCSEGSKTEHSIQSATLNVTRILMLSCRNCRTKCSFTPVFQKQGANISHLNERQIWKARRKVAAFSICIVLQRQETLKNININFLWKMDRITVGRRTYFSFLMP